MGSALLSVGLVIGIAAILTVVVKSIKQPPIIAYIITGVLAGPLFLNLINLNNDSSELILIFAHMGVAFLLFIVGLSLDFRVLKEVGKVSALTGFSEILITAGVGFLIAISLGFGNLTGIYIAAALAFSSTVIIVKILSDKKEIDTLHGKLALGILIVEDFVAALALMARSILSILSCSS
ncbi:cation:proton antiporter [Candidatus Pacearchaeota archaeon]|nr:cation:proton antiporter [Candidatus Pacearchaeota archaeon]